MTTRFTDELMEQGLTYKVLTLVSQIDVNNEFEKLQRERGLGSEKHRKEVSVRSSVHSCLCHILKEQKSRVNQNILLMAMRRKINYIKKVWSVHEIDLHLSNLFLVTMCHASTVSRVRPLRNWLSCRGKLG